MSNHVKDERVEQNRTKALANAAIIGEILLGIRIFYEIINGEATLGTTGWYIGILVVMNVVMLISLYRSKTIDTPKTLLGQSLSTGLSKRAKRERLYKSYIPESLIAAAGLSLGSYLSSGYNGLAPTIILYVFYFGIYLTITYYWNEHEIKRYNEDLED